MSQKIEKMAGTLIILSLFMPHALGWVPNPEKSKNDYHHQQYQICRVVDSEKDICLQCKKGYFLKNGYCRQCPIHCSKCSDDSTCSECHIGAYLSENLCYKCHRSCMVCSKRDVCEQCNEMYNLIDGECVDHFEGNFQGLVKIVVLFLVIVAVCCFQFGGIMVGRLDGYLGTKEDLHYFESSGAPRNDDSSFFDESLEKSIEKSGVVLNKTDHEESLTRAPKSEKILDEDSELLAKRRILARDSTGSTESQLLKIRYKNMNNDDSEIDLLNL